MKVRMTGPSGFIGQNLVPRLKDHCIVKELKEEQS